MMSCKIRNIGEFVLCSCCKEQVAFLYCADDCAMLCLLCDQHVHYNKLCRGHLRLRVCDNCGTEPAIVHCAADKLVLCDECDQDVHDRNPQSATHARKPVGAFSGSPSPIDIALAWGLNIEGKRPHMPLRSGPNLGDAFLNSLMGNKKVSSSGLLEDVIAPNYHNTAFIYSEKEVGRGTSGSRSGTPGETVGGFVNSWISSTKVSPSESLEDLVMQTHDNPAVIHSKCGRGRLTKEETQMLRSLEKHLMDDNDDRWWKFTRTSGNGV